MAAFALSYLNVTREDIRYIYSYKPTHFFIPSPRPFSKTSQFLPEPLLKRFPPRFYDYYPAFKMGLPRAPAFNKMPLSEVRQMVERMGKPITCQRDRQKEDRSRLSRVKVVRFESITESENEDREYEGIEEDEGEGKQTLGGKGHQRDTVKVVKKGEKQLHLRESLEKETRKQHPPHGSKDNTKSRTLDAEVSRSKVKGESEAKGLTEVKGTEEATGDKLPEIKNQKNETFNNPKRKKISLKFAQLRLPPVARTG